MNEKPPLISILTASYNSGATIRETIESIKNQTFADYEHLIIDNQSTDRTLEIIREHENTYPLRWISEPDAGIADALNKGLKMSEGRYSLVIHADDRLLDPHVLENVYPELINEVDDIVVFSIIMNDPRLGKVHRPNKTVQELRFRICLRHQGAFIHKRLHDNIGPYNHFRLAMDYDFFYRAFNARARFKIINRPIAEMGGGGTGTYRQNFSLLLEEFYQVQRLNEKNIFWRIIQCLYHIYKKHFRRWLRPSFREFKYVKQPKQEQPPRNENA